MAKIIQLYSDQLQLMVLFATCEGCGAQKKCVVMNETGETLCQPCFKELSRVCRPDVPLGEELENYDLETRTVLREFRRNGV